MGATRCRASGPVSAGPGGPDRWAATSFRIDPKGQRSIGSHSALIPELAGDGTGLRFETGEHGGDYPDNMPQAITLTDAQGRWVIYVPLRVGGKIVVPEPSARCG
jgi:hypothetical protein